MKITEIELVGDQNWDVEQVKKILAVSTPYGGVIDNLNVNYAEFDNQRSIILTNDQQDIAAFASFEIWNNGKVWQAKNCQSYPPYQSQNLIVKIYVFVKNVLHKSIQSDSEQSYGGKKLWCKSLPEFGMNPMIFDTKTERIIDPASVPDIDSLMYPNSPDANNIMPWRYTWIIEHRDHYPSQNLVIENSLLLPIQGLWKK